VILEDQLKGVDRNFSVLLVDDVTTSGGHLQGCVARLQTKQLNTKNVVCGGKTIYDQANRAFHVYEYTLENYQP
jgi:orotate phosphoribosyltransferase